MTYEEALELLGGPIEPTRDEIRNGWAKYSLTIYHAERQVASADAIFHPKARRPQRTTNRMKWPIGRR